MIFILGDGIQTES